MEANCLDQEPSPAMSYLAGHFFYTGLLWGSFEGDVLVEGSTDPDRFADVDVHVLGLNAELARAVTNFNRNTGHFIISNLPAIRVGVSAQQNQVFRLPRSIT